jgi:2,5-diketo-D-gluconate reductase A
LARAVAGTSAIALGHGAQLSRIGLGTWPLSDREAERAVVDAVEAGYRLFDTAYAYGNEQGVGKGLRACGLPRAELFVTTKLNGQWHGYEAAQEAWVDSARRLEVDYIDLLLIHWPLPAQDRYVDAWRGLVRLLEDGCVRAIGTSNFKPAHLARLLDEIGVVPDVNQIQLSPYTTRDAARAYHAEHGIVTQSWSPLGLGRELLREPVIVEIAERHRRTVAQTVLRWHIELGLAAVPKTQQPARMAENIDVFDWQLSDAEISAISALDRGEAFADDSDVIGH